MTEQGSQQVPIGEAMRLATDHHQAGRLPEAEAIYRAVLAAEPSHAGAAYNLALIALQRGRAREALPALREAARREPRNAAHLMNYAVALAGSGEPQAARDLLLQARERGHAGKALDALLEQVQRMVRSTGPTVVETVGQDGSAPLRAPNLSALLDLYQRGQHAQVEAQARALLPEFPKSVALLRLLGGSLLAQDRFEEARDVLSRAGQAGVDDALLHRMLGIALRRLERNEEAKAEFERSLAIAPDDFDTLLNASANAATLREHALARRYAERARVLRPDSVAALRVLADAAAVEGSREEAVDLYRRAIAIEPAVADLYVNLGDTLAAMGRIAEAEAELERALALRPNDAQAHLNLGSVLFRLGQTGAALRHYRTASDLAPNRPDVQMAYLFCLLHDESVAPEHCFEEHVRIGDLIEAPRRHLQRPHENDRDPARGLRVGFVSGDLRDHAVAYLIEPVWQAMRGGRHQLIAYANVPFEDAVSERLRSLVDSWVRVERLDDAALAERIRQDRIDILFDLSGHTLHNRLPVFAMRPAPVQATMIGYPGTTGLSAMDYRVVRRSADEIGNLQRLNREKLVRVPFRGFLPEPGAPEVQPLPALTNGFLTFGSFNRLSKVSEATIDLWSRVLHAIPDAKMLVGAAGEPRAEERLRAQFESCGISPARLSFRPRMQMVEYLALHHEVDVVLDTFPYTGGTTTSQALWMGVPVLTLEGSTSQQRQSATILAMLGLDEWATRTPEAYVEQARAAAADLPALDRLRQSLRPKLAASVYGSQDAVRREMDTALQTMWRRWCAGLPPESFAVSD